MPGRTYPMKRRGRVSSTARPRRGDGGRTSPRSKPKSSRNLPRHYLRSSTRVENRAIMDNKDIKAEDLVWIFGTGRGGSTWLASMMGESAGGRFWDEPLVGKLFGDLYYSGAGTVQSDWDDFVYARKYRDVWLRSIRNFVLESASVRFSGVAEN